MIGLRTAEDVKIQLGTAFISDNEEYVEKRREKDECFMMTLIRKETSIDNMITF